MGNFYVKLGGVHRLTLRDPEDGAGGGSDDSDRFMNGGSVDDFFAFLNAHAQNLSDAEIVESLGDYLSPADMGGLAMRIRAELAMLKDDDTIW